MTNLYNFIFVDPWPWWLGGIAIGLLVPVMYYFLNTPLGVSTGYGNLVKMIIPKTKLKWLTSKNFADTLNWRFFFMAGMILGGFFSARSMGFPVTTMDMGRFTAIVDWPFLSLAVWFFCGGLLLGLGARLAGGCTSGHSIHGLANLHISSLIATIFFLLFGAITVWLIRVFVFGGI
ncbi:MAG TPA: YeeE/YedE thiosulfate transporter family protein [Candidatus Limnocylindrales bacterium]|nr:YeeE/YedE thiosulfate transporter family protein [Candidatus Limnocylindrales bacterium]